MYTILTEKAIKKGWRNLESERDMPRWRKNGVQLMHAALREGQCKETYINKKKLRFSFLFFTLVFKHMHKSSQRIRGNFSVQKEKFSVNKLILVLCFLFSPLKHYYRNPYLTYSTCLIVLIMV